MLSKDTDFQSKMLNQSIQFAETQIKLQPNSDSLEIKSGLNSSHFPYLTGVAFRFGSISAYYITEDLPRLKVSTQSKFYW